jgi:hypothetical protein
LLNPYPAPVEQVMRFTYASLNERQRRLYAANEALKLEHGGVAYVAHLFGCHRKTVQRGLLELQGTETPLPAHQARKKGGAGIDACPSFPDSMMPS